MAEPRPRLPACSPHLLPAVLALVLLATLGACGPWSVTPAAPEGQKGAPPLAWVQFGPDGLLIAALFGGQTLHELRASLGEAEIETTGGLSPRIESLESQGCTITMGSDNMAEDMVEVMRTGLFMERIRREDGRHPTPEQALRWASRNGYKAFGMPDGGWLAAGNKADFIVIDTQRAHLVPMLRAVPLRHR